MNGQSQTLSTALALTASSAIDFGTGQTTANSILTFANSNAQTWTGTEAIDDWIGSATGGGEDQLFFDASSTGLTTAQIADVTFVNPTVNGVPDTGTYAATILSTGEVVPTVPEPATLGLLAVAGTMLMLRRKRI